MISKNNKIFSCFKALKHTHALAITCFILGLPGVIYAQQIPHLSKPSADQSIFLRSNATFKGGYTWQMQRVKEAGDNGKKISSAPYNTSAWQPAIVPGTVLNSLVANKVYPEPYYGDNNKRLNFRIPDIEDAGREFYHYWFRTKFKVPATFKGKRTWLKFHGINYRCEIWLNGKELGKMAGMFNTQAFDVTGIVKTKQENILAVNVSPVDVTGGRRKATTSKIGASGENFNGGDHEIGRNVTMLMSVGWDFSAPDGIRDRNTGIWRDVELFTTNDVTLANAFVQTKLPLPDTSFSKETVSVEVSNASGQVKKGVLSGKISESGILFSKQVTLAPHETQTVVFTPEEYKTLIFSRPKLWWPINKGKQNLYNLSLQFADMQGVVSHTIHTRFGVREVTSDQNTPDRSRRFLVNGQPIFIRGTNWVPEAMLRNSEKRTYAELRYTKQAGLNFIRLWAGGIAESDYFYDLCDEFGFLVWNEFWVTADTKHPDDTALYFKNVTSTIKRIRNHASVAHYVGANEGTEVPGTGELIHWLDPTKTYQEESECCGVHDGSPYKYENPMQYFENTASRRGSRIDGFNPEYGAPCIPIVESLREMMPKSALWPISDSVWNYLDGNGFHQVTTKYRAAVNQFGESASVEEFAKKAQFVGAMNFRSIWEVWDYNKFGFGDRWASGFLFWYHNSPLPQTASRMYDWYLEPTAALYYSQNGLAPLHPQFDYLKNTVSVYNDYRVAFAHYTVQADVYDLDAKLVLTRSANIDIPADGLVKDAFKIDFPDTVSQVHFIKLTLKDNNGKKVADAFYWRSKDLYKKAWTMTGPAVSGFQDMAKLPKVNLLVSAKSVALGDKVKVDIVVKNTSGGISFFTQLKLKDADEQNIKPAFFSDNFFCLLPSEEKHVTVEFSRSDLKGDRFELRTEAYNSTVTSNKLTIK